MKNKIIHLIVFILFVYFCLVQLNDVDPYKWILIYGLVLVYPVMGFFKLEIKWLKKTVLFILIILFVSTLPQLFNWINAGMPAFIDYEPTNIKEVEEIREFFGMSVAFVTALIYNLK